MWLFLWIVFVLVALGFFLWSYHATYEQKRAWKAFAFKNNLEYFGGKFMDTPAMRGIIKGHEMNFYPQIVENAQGQRSVKNVIEIFLNNQPDFLGVVASPGFVDFVSLLNLAEPFQVNHPDWPKNILARTITDEAPELWFMGNVNRIKAIQKLEKLPFDMAFLSDGEQAFVAIRTANPFSSDSQLEKLIGVLLSVVTAFQEPDVSITANPNDDNVTEDPDNSASNP
jgi:hypothetical protein